MKIPTSEELAYCAGVIDSDGCIAIAYSNAEKHPAARCRELITAGQSTPEVIELLSTLFGGKVLVKRSKHKNQRDHYVWARTGKSAISTLKQLLPFLRLKQAQAINLIELYELKQAAKQPKTWTPNPAYKDRILACINKAYELNYLGHANRRYAHERPTRWAE